MGRRMNKKGKVDEQAKKRTRKVQKFQKPIVGMSLDDIRQKKAQKPQLRQAAKEAAAEDAKARMALKAKAAPKSGAAKAGAKAGGKKQQEKLPKGGGAAQGAKKDFKGKK